MERRIKDKKVLSLIEKFLKAGVMEQGKTRNTMLGAPGRDSQPTSGEHIPARIGQVWSI